MAIDDILDEHHFNEKVLKSEKPALVDFYGECCHPCVLLMPILEELAIYYSGYMNMFKIKDSDANETLFSRYNITRIPTIMVFESGQVQKVWQRLASKEELMTFLNRRFDIPKSDNRRRKKEAKAATKDYFYHRSKSRAKKIDPNAYEDERISFLIDKFTEFCSKGIEETMRNASDPARKQSILSDHKTLLETLSYQSAQRITGRKMSKKQSGILQEIDGFLRDYGKFFSHMMDYLRDECPSGNIVYKELKLAIYHAVERYGKDNVRQLYTNHMSTSCLPSANMPQPFWTDAKANALIIELDYILSTHEKMDRKRMDVLREIGLRKGAMLNPDNAVVERIIKGLDMNREKYGFSYCPCSKIKSDEDKDRSIICPCDELEASLEKEGQCHCGLYVRK